MPDAFTIPGNEWSLQIRPNYLYDLTGLNLSTTYADDTAAAAGGIPIGQAYRNGSVVMVRIA